MAKKPYRAGEDKLALGALRIAASQPGELSAELLSPDDEIIDGGAVVGDAIQWEFGARFI